MATFVPRPFQFNTTPYRAEISALSCRWHRLEMTLMQLWGGLLRQPQELVLRLKSLRAALYAAGKRPNLW